MRWAKNWPCLEKRGLLHAPYVGGKVIEYEIHQLRTILQNLSIVVFQKRPVFDIESGLDGSIPI